MVAVGAQRASQQSAAAGYFPCSRLQGNDLGMAALYATTSRPGTHQNPTRASRARAGLEMLEVVAPKKPGHSTGNQGGSTGRWVIKAERSRTMRLPPDNKPLPPPTKPGDGWVPVKVTPGSNR